MWSANDGYFASASLRWMSTISILRENTFRSFPTSTQFFLKGVHIWFFSQSLSMQYHKKMSRGRDRADCTFFFQNPLPTISYRVTFPLAHDIIQKGCGNPFAYFRHFNKWNFLAQPCRFMPPWWWLPGLTAWGVVHYSVTHCLPILAPS